MSNRPHPGITMTDKMLKRIAELEAGCNSLHEHIARKDRRIAELEAENERLRAVFKRLEERLKYIDPVALDIAREALAAVEEKDDELPD